MAMYLSILYEFNNKDLNSENVGFTPLYLLTYIAFLAIINIWLNKTQFFINKPSITVFSVKIEKSNIINSLPTWSQKSFINVQFQNKCSMVSFSDFYFLSPISLPCTKFGLSMMFFKNGLPSWFLLLSFTFFLIYSSLFTFSSSSLFFVCILQKKTSTKKNAGARCAWREHDS